MLDFYYRGDGTLKSLDDSFDIYSGLNGYLFQVPGLMRSKKDMIYSFFKQVYDIVKNPKSPVLYYSCPISSGKKLYELLADGVDEKKAVDLAISHNTDLNLENCLRVQNQLGLNSTMINPSKIQCDKLNFTQDEWIDVWNRVMISFAEVCFFAPGYEFSRGACKEFLITYKDPYLKKITLDGHRGIMVACDVDKNEITPTILENKLIDVIDFMRVNNFQEDLDYFQNILKELKN